MPHIVQVIPLSVESKGTISKNRTGTTIRVEYRVVSRTMASNAVDFLEVFCLEKNVALGDPYPHSQNAVLKSISAKRTGSDKQADGPFVWNVTLEYGPEEEVEKKNTNSCRISVTTETNDETDGRYDRANNLNVNSAGDFFEDKLPLKNSLLVIRYQLDYIDNPNSTLMNVFLHTNSAAWYGLQKGTCLVRSISSERNKDEEGEYYWSVSIEIAYNPDGWVYKKADCGFYDNNGRILDDQGAPVEKAQLLNGAGERNYSGTPVMLEYKLYNEVSFTGMNLPNPFN